uniref:Secreted protein n=1 Tax=Anguilla anguilla TaxID=7936 RepID=A0A0E9WSP9_ANGAN
MHLNAFSLFVTAFQLLLEMHIALAVFVIVLEKCYVAAPEWHDCNVFKTAYCAIYSKGLMYTQTTGILVCGLEKNVLRFKM